MLQKLHRWLGLLMFLPILGWTVGGLYFSLIPIQQIRGEHLVQSVAPDAEHWRATAAPGEALAVLNAEYGQELSFDGISMTSHLGEPAYRVEFTLDGTSRKALVSAYMPRVVPPMSERAATERARELVGTEPVRLSFIEEVAPDSEYRGKPLPAWRADFEDPEQLHLYMDATTGEVTARRTQRWRIFDFLWMLHIMDFEERNNFNHALLSIAALLAITLTISGVLLWAVRKVRKRRRRRAMA